ncbi:MAG TPA: hypothetical protein VJ507_00590 [Candidatus Bathyarchaeia archaeon]|nr:hypothetical protein [Candidatus Bathyarchaeia archaeon]
MARIDSIIAFFKSGNVFLLIIGASLALWLNWIVIPELVVVLGFPLNPSVQNIIGLLIIAIICFVFWAYVYKKIFKNLRATWFFVGASFISLFLASINLHDISVLYYLNVDTVGYSYPAIYIFKLFRSIFFTTVFGILGYWNELRKKENKPKVDSGNKEAEQEKPFVPSEEDKKRAKIIYEIVMKRYDREWQRTKDLDSKASGVTGFVGILATLIVGISKVIPQLKYDWLLIPAVILLVVSAFLGVCAY